MRCIQLTTAGAMLILSGCAIQSAESPGSSEASTTQAASVDEASVDAWLKKTTERCRAELTGSSYRACTEEGKWTAQQRRRCRHECLAGAGATLRNIIARAAQACADRIVASKGSAPLACEFSLPAGADPRLVDGEEPRCLDRCWKLAQVDGGVP